jgi:hypothetical protein
MKNLPILLFFVSNLLFSQYNSYLPKETFNNKFNINCDVEPLGIVKELTTLPPTYTFLESNGYCYYFNPAQSFFSYCFYFIANTENVFLNSGFSAVGCNNIIFSGFTLCDITDGYTVGNGQYFTNLTVGNTYVWCLTGSASGIGCQGFNTFCPYWFNENVLPVKLIFFNGFKTDNGIKLEWITLSESNSECFFIEKSLDGFNYYEIGSIDAQGFSNKEVKYEFLDKIVNTGNVYYRLKQMDFDGRIEIFEPIVIYNNGKKILKVTDLNGRKININTSGFKVIFFDDGSYLKVIN